VHAGTIAECVGNPSAAPNWRCGFYPGSRPRECSNGTAATFQTAREAFEAAWQIFLPWLTFRSGANIRLGPLRNIAALIEVSGWERTGGQREALQCYA
jgi:hypothetical protein